MKPQALLRFLQARNDDEGKLNDDEGKLYDNEGKVKS